MMLVSAIMPTRNRPEFAARALECFRLQTYRHRELVIVDDADAPSFATAPSDANVYYHRIYVTPRLTVGAKRNVACAKSAGSVLMHWDDDDWSSPERMQDQVRRLVESDCPITGYRSMLFRDETGQGWWYEGPGPSYALGTSLCYTRGFWKQHAFPDQDCGEENAMVMHARKIVSVDAGPFMVASIHAGNTSVRRTECVNWERCA